MNQPPLRLRPGGFGRTLAPHKAGTRAAWSRTPRTSSRQALSRTPCPAGRSTPCTMDPTRPLELSILLLLLTEAALGDAAQEPTGNNAEICLLPLDYGPCRALLPRYYYDRYTQRCRQFLYGGCEGNANNFYTWEACDEACWRIEKVPKVCRLQVSVDDQCEGSTEKYFFNLSSMTCEKFSSGGCHRNWIENRFPDEVTCMAFCAPKKSPSFCYSPKDEGLCSANVTRYYFNPRYKTCDAFTYTGCGGNDNNFVSREDCRRACAKALKRKKKIPKFRFASRIRKIRKKQF
ncbi:tissue factor pathway inhibitor 2 [Papio anubis]|uniref:Tissue factor pathway inhibitor n=1 Tax=Papio anubis TaxID=9555 RepID=A0A8I5NBR9_PAPAN|nr:tissue factor pathway inhibitor 2 [Papio anubis]